MAKKDAKKTPPSEGDPKKGTAAASQPKVDPAPPKVKASVVKKKKQKATIITLEVMGDVEVKAYEEDLSTVRAILNPAPSKAGKDMSRLGEWIIKYAPEDLLGKKETVEVVLDIMERVRVNENMVVPTPVELAGLDPVGNAAQIARSREEKVPELPSSPMTDPLPPEELPPFMDGVDPGAERILPAMPVPQGGGLPPEVNPMATTEPDTVAPTTGPQPEPGYENILTVAEAEELNRYLNSHVAGVKDKDIIRTILQYQDGIRAKKALDFLKEKEKVIREWEDKKVNMMTLMVEYKGMTKAELLPMAKNMAKPRLCQMSVAQLKTYLKNHIV